MTEYFAAYMSYLCGTLEPKAQDEMERELSLPNSDLSVFRVALDVHVANIWASIGLGASALSPSIPTELNQAVLNGFRKRCAEAMEFAQSRDSLLLCRLFPSDPVHTAPVLKERARIAGALLLEELLKGESFAIEEMTEAASGVLADLGAGSEEAAVFASAFAERLSRAGTTEAARQWLDKVHAQIMAEQGHFSWARAVVVARQASLLSRTTEGAASLSLFVEAANVLLLEAGPTDPWLHRVVGEHAQVAHLSGHLDQAETLATKALRWLSLIQRKSHDDCRQQVMALLRLGAICHDRRDYNRGIQHVEAATSLNSAELKDEYLLALTVVLQAELVEASGRLAEAESVYRRACVLMQEQNSTPDMQWARYRHARVLLRLPLDPGRLAESRSLLARVKWAMHRAHMRGGVFEAAVLQECSLCHILSNKPIQAEASSRASVTLLEAAQNVDAMMLAVSRSRLADTLRATGLFREARTLYEVTITAIEAIPGADKRYPLWLRIGMARCWTGEGQAATARELLQDVSRRMAATGAMDHILMDAVDSGPPATLQVSEPHRKAGGGPVVALTRAIALGTDVSVKPLVYIDSRMKVADAIRLGVHF